MKTIKIILFIILTLSLIFFTLFLDIVIIFSGASGASLDKVYQFLVIATASLQLAGFLCYWKLLKKLQNKLDLSQSKELAYWVIAFIALMLIPLGWISLLFFS